MKYIQKRKPISAWHFGSESMPDWVVAADGFQKITVTENAVYIKTLDGTFRATPGDYIILDPDATIRFMSEQEFLAQYEPIESERGNEYELTFTREGLINQTHIRAQMTAKDANKLYKTLLAKKPVHSLAMRKILK